MALRSPHAPADAVDAFVRLDVLALHRHPPAVAIEDDRVAPARVGPCAVAHLHHAIVLVKKRE